MLNFKKEEVELTTRLDKWFYFIKHLEDFQSILEILENEVIFEKAFEKAELAKLNNAQWESYESSLKEYRDIKGYIDTAFDEGKMEEKPEMIKNLTMEFGFTDRQTTQAAKVSIEFVKDLRKCLNK